MKPKKKQPKYTVNTSCKCKLATKYHLVTDVVRKIFGWKTTDFSGADCDLFWTDSAISPEKLAKLKAHQSINHFPGMYFIARKNTMANRLNKLRALFPKEYNFYPKTWLLPSDLNRLTAELAQSRSTYILKPEASSQGRGIRLIHSLEDLAAVGHAVVQKYIDRPLLIDGCKFDLRLYVLVASADPLRVFIHEEGLVRLATEAYAPPSKSNSHQTCMHLTNYAVNKANPGFVGNERVEEYIGHKRSLTSFMLHLERTGADVPALWRQIGDLVVKTLLAIQPSVAHSYNSCRLNDPHHAACFEILGVDVLLDNTLRPYLLEVNHSPSFSTDSQLDYEIKSKVIADTLRIMGFGLSHRTKCLKFKNKLLLMRNTGNKTFQELRTFVLQQKAKESLKRDQHETAADTGYFKIYPSQSEDYARFLRAAQQEWDDFFLHKHVRRPSRRRKERQPASPEFELSGTSDKMRTSGQGS